MKQRKPLFYKKLLIASILLIFFSVLLYLLFGYRRDEKEFLRITNHLFREEMTANTLNMHYTLAQPENFGIQGYHSILPCYQKENTLTSRAATENLLAALSKVDISNLPEDQQYTHTLLRRSLENSMALSQYPYYEEPLSPGSGMQSQLPILLAEYTFRDAGDVEDYLALLDQTDEYFASLLTFEQEKATAGLLMSANSLMDVIEQCDTIVTLSELDGGTHFLQTTFEERLVVLLEAGLLSEVQVAEYSAENNRLLKEVLVPAYEALGDGLFLLQENCTELSGLGTKPDGSAYYEQLLISQTGSYRDIPEIKELLLSKYAEEQDAIRSIINAYPEVLDYMTNQEHSDFPLMEAEEMLQHLQFRMSENFPNIPEAETISSTVKTVSESLQDYCAPAFYLTPPIDDTDSNVIYINQKNSPQGLELYTTLAHEGYPGHLYQTVFSNRYMTAQEENLVRQLLWYGGYLEGWALYVEFLSFDYASASCSNAGMEEEAILALLEKHNRSMQLCLYSLLDIMIHYEGASMTQISEVLAEVGIDNPSSAKAIYTYIAEEPCNYLKYYLGYLEILELQKLAKTHWGDNYSDYAFHTFYLECGPSDFTSLKERLLSSSSNILSK